MDRLVRILKSKFFIIGISLLLFYTLSGFFLIPYLVRHYVPEVIMERYGKKARIGEVRFNPYIFILEASHFTVNEPDDHLLFGFQRLIVDFELKSIFKWAWTFQRIALQRPRVNAVIASDGALNLAQFAPASEKPPLDTEEAPDQDKGDDPPPRLFVKYLSIDEGEIDLTDKRQSEPATVNFAPLNLHVVDLTTFPEEKGRKTITVATGDGETFRWAGSFSLNPVATQGTIVFENIKTSSLWEFLRDSVNLDVPEGNLNVAADYRIDLGDAEPEAMLSNLSITLTDMILKLTGSEEPFLELPDAGITETEIDLVNNRIDIGSLKLNGGRVRLLADERGMFNLERIIKAADAPEEEEKAISASEGDENSAWRINLAAFEIDRMGLHYQDRSRKQGLQAEIGDIEMDFKAEFQTGVPQTRLLVSDLVINLSEITARLPDTTKSAISIDKFALQAGAYDLMENHFIADKISIEGGNVDFLRETDGSTNLALLAKPPKRETSDEKTDKAPDEAAAFQFMIKTVSVSGLEAALSDLSVKKNDPIVNLEGIDLVVNNVDGKSPMKFDAGLKVRQGGRIRAAGTIHPSAPSAQGDIQVEDLELTPFQPYIEQAAYLILESGRFSTRGALQYGIEGTDAQTAFEGGFRVDDLRLIEPESSETFLGWKNLRTDNLQLHLEPNRLVIGQLDVAEIISTFIIYEDQTLNIVKVMKNDADAGPEPPLPSETDAQTSHPFPFQVQRINFSDGTVDFADLSLTPQFGTRIHELKGTILGIDAEKDKYAEINLDGRVDDYGTAEVKGKLNTSDPTAFTDIKLIFRNVEMTKLTPYSSKFAGRKIESGKLSLDLAYQIKDNRLVGNNEIVMEHLDLGKKVESPEAVDLPLDLAIALLEDSNGVIDIGLPVKGTLDDPEFSLGGLLWKTFTNLLKKMVTSPFRALASLVPGGEDETLNTIVFEAGRSSVSPPEKEKLMKMTAALKKRPRLKLTVQGPYNPEADMDALRAASLRRSLAVRLGRTPEPGEAPGPVDYGNPETVAALEEMFKKHFGLEAFSTLKGKAQATQEKEEKGADATPELKDKDGDRYAKMLFARLKDAEPVGSMDLLQLAEKRSRAIMDELSVPDGIPGERIEIKSPAAVSEDQPTAVLELAPVQ